MGRYWQAGVILLLVLLTSGTQAGQVASGLVPAVKQGDREAVRALLREGTGVNQAEPDGTTALHWAVQADDLDLITTLIRAGADVHAANRYGLQPLTLAARNGSAAALATLLDAGANPNTATGGGEPALMTAARAGKVDAVRLLLSRGADPHAREAWFGETALMWAAADDHADVVRTLVQSGAAVNAQSTVLDAPVLEFPQSGGPNSPFPRGGWTALMFAARHGALEAARALADLGSDLDAVALPQTDIPLTAEQRLAAENGVGTTALVFAIINVHYDLAAMLIEKGANLHVEDVAGMTALYAATDMNTLQWVQGRPAPVLTDRLDAVDIVRLLLERGADPNVQLKARPLRRHHDAGSTLNFGEGATPLMRAARTNDVAVMRLLLDAGADPLLTLPDGTTALMMAAGLGYGGLRGDGPRIVIPTPEGAVEAVELLLDRGADINASNTAGNTALHGAVTRGDAVVRALAARGAVLDVKNKAGFTPLDLALGRGGRGGRGGVVRESTATLIRQLMDEAPARGASLSLP